MHNRLFVTNILLFRVDVSRIKDVGPDRAAAEWLIRCGAGVRWKDSENLLKDYNSLSGLAYGSKFIEEIDATGSCIMSNGFPHLSEVHPLLNVTCTNFEQLSFSLIENLKFLKKMILHDCQYLDDEALPLLAHVKDSLTDLQLTNCGNISDPGVESLAALVNLKHLKLKDLPEVNNKEGCMKILQAALAQCIIDFP